MNRVLKTSYSLLIVLPLFLMVVNSCKPDNDEPAPRETGTMTDVDNHVYKTVKIGNQWWMAEDLRVTKYRNGNSILRSNLESQSQSDSIQWVTDTIGSYCNALDNGNNIIGKYYNYFAVNNINKIAPSGWHIPTDDEWKELEKNIGMSQAEADKAGWRGSQEGDKMKIEGPKSWTEYNNVWGTNEFGFTALPNGSRLFNSELGYPGFASIAFWWSSTTHADNEAWYRYLDYKNANVFRSHCTNNYGFSVRCVKD